MVDDPAWAGQFRYLADGLVAALVEQVPEVNPTPKYLAHLSQTMRERGLHAIFIPRNSSSRLARRIAAGAAELPSKAKRREIAQPPGLCSRKRVLNQPNTGPIRPD